jgi:hypothetical protein
MPSGERSSVRPATRGAANHAHLELLETGRRCLTTNAPQSACSPPSRCHSARRTCAQALVARDCLRPHRGPISSRVSRSWVAALLRCYAAGYLDRSSPSTCTKTMGLRDLPLEHAPLSLKPPSTPPGTPSCVAELYMSLSQLGLGTTIRIHCLPGSNGWPYAWGSPLSGPSPWPSP